MNCSGPFEHRYFPIKMCYGQSQFLGRLIRSPGPPRWRKGSGALEEKGSGVLKEKKTIFFSTLLCLSQYNSVARGHDFP